MIGDNDIAPEIGPDLLADRIINKASQLSQWGGGSHIIVSQLFPSILTPLTNTTLKAG